MNALEQAVFKELTRICSGNRHSHFQGECVQYIRPAIKPAPSMAARVRALESLQKQGYVEQRVYQNLRFGKTRWHVRPEYLPVTGGSDDKPNT